MDKELSTREKLKSSQHPETLFPRPSASSICPYSTQPRVPSPSCCTPLLIPKTQASLRNLLLGTSCEN